MSACATREETKVSEQDLGKWFCDLEAAHKVEAALQIEWRGKIDRRKILNGYQQQSRRT